MSAAVRLRGAGVIVAGRPYQAGNPCRTNLRMSRTRASVNDLAGLVAVGDRVGVYGVVTDRTDASYAALTAEWDAAPLMNNVRTTKIDATSGMLFWDGDYSYPPEENKRVKFCVYHPYAPVGTGGDNYVEAVAGHSPVLHFKLTGAEDVMWAASGHRFTQAGSFRIDF